MGSTTVINIPTDPKAFEEQCVVLFAGVLDDPNVKLFGTQGKAQFGLDLLGARGGDPAKAVGVQCKLISRGAKLGGAVVRKEVESALAVAPALAEFFIVTTATDEPSLDLLALRLSQEQAVLGRTIKIQIWGWDTLQQRIRADPKALNAFDPNYSASTSQFLALGAEAAEGQSQLLAQNLSILQGIEEIKRRLPAGPLDPGHSDGLDAHLDVQVDTYRAMLNQGQPKTALKLLQALEASLPSTSSPAIRARIKANLAFAHIKLDAKEVGVRLLEEAYALNPTDPKVRGNAILAKALKGDLDGAWALAKAVLAEDPTNVGAAAMAFQVAALSPEGRDPSTFVPPPLLDDLNVCIHRIGYLHQHGDAAEWWALAADTFDRFPDDGVALRFSAEALLEKALSSPVADPRSNLPPERRALLELAVERLQQHWAVVRAYENAADPNFVGVALNLAAGYRALGNEAKAKALVDEALALTPDAEDARVLASQLAMDRKDYPAIITHLQAAPEGPVQTISLAVAHSNLGQWAEVIAVATPERRAALKPADQQLLDVMVFRARQALDPEGELDEAVAQLLEAWPLGMAAHIGAADVYRLRRPDLLAGMAAKALSLLTPQTAFADRLMFAQLSLLRGAWDDIIAALDGFVTIDQPSEALDWLALAFANAQTRPRTTRFFASLPQKLIALPRYARMAGAAEHNRGDLHAAERYLRAALHAEPRDLRAVLLLVSTLGRSDRFADAVDVVRDVQDDAMIGAPSDLMRLAHHHRRAGDVERALGLGYRTAAAHREDEMVLSGYPSLIFLDERLPPELNLAGPAARGFWFDLEGQDTQDVNGVIDDQKIGDVPTFAPDHPLAVGLLGKAVGDEVVLSAGIGPPRRYKIRQLKHKYLWMLHDIMGSYAARFPTAQSLIQVNTREGDVQPILDMVRDFQRRDDVIAQTYADFPVPLVAIAAATGRNVIAFADQLSRQGAQLRTSIGLAEERDEAQQVVRLAKGRGVVLDTLTVWQLYDLGQLAAAKAYFGRLCLPRSSFDDFMEMRGRIEANRGREFMTLGYEGEQAWRQTHTVEDTEQRLAAMNTAIQAIQTCCEILPVDGSDNAQLDRVFGRDAVQAIMDPIHLARAEHLALLSEDLHLRQLAAQQGVRDGAWLQVTLQTMAADGVLPVRDYLISVGILGARGHDHLWLDAATLAGVLSLKDDRAFAFFQEMLKFIGGLKADMPSHLTVALQFIRLVWSVDLPFWRQQRAIGLLLTQLVESRRGDWRTALQIIESELDQASRLGDWRAARGHTYVVDWIRGHFLDLSEIRSEQRPLRFPRLSKSRSMVQLESKHKGRRA